MGKFIEYKLYNNHLDVTGGHIFGKCSWLPLALQSLLEGTASVYRVGNHQSWWW